ncbi:MAG: DUF2255 family protein [Chloroflexi bacterium]|nr:DUF2255 family protein [Chloroflexota bacterium]
MTAFPAIVLEAFRVRHEVEVETASAGGEVHRVVIWIVVVGDVPYVRSVRGAKGRWYRELLRQGDGAIHVGPRRIPVRAKRVTDAAENARVSEAIQQKYVRPVASVNAMIRDEVLATTARLEPV